MAHILSALKVSISLIILACKFEYFSHTARCLFPIAELVSDRQGFLKSLKCGMGADGKVNLSRSR